MNTPVVPGFQQDPDTQVEDSGEVEVTAGTIWKENRKLVKEILEVNHAREETIRLTSKNRETANMVRSVSIAAVAIVFMVLMPKSPEVMLELMSKFLGAFSPMP